MRKNHDHATGALFKPTMGGRIFDGVNITILLILCLVTVYPLYYVLCASFSDNIPLLSHPGALLYPMVAKPLPAGATAVTGALTQEATFGFSLGAYRLAFTHPLLVSGYLNILTVLAVSLPLNIILTLFCGFFMASKNVLLKKPIVG